MSTLYMPSEELSAQEDTYIKDYAIYYNLPQDLDWEEIVELICQAHKQIPVLNHLTYDFYHDGSIYFTGRLRDVEVTTSNDISRFLQVESSAPAPNPNPAQERREGALQRPMLKLNRLLRPLPKRAQGDVQIADAPLDQLSPSLRPSHTAPGPRTAVPSLGSLSVNLNNDSCPSRGAASAAHNATGRPLPQLERTWGSLEDLGDDDEEAPYETPSRPRRSLSQPTRNSAPRIASSDDNLTPIHLSRNAPSPSTGPSPRNVLEKNFSPDGNEENDDSFFPVPFPTIDESPVSSPNPNASSPASSPRGRRFSYPPTISGDWLHTMVDDVVQGRKDLKQELEDAKQEVRLALETVMRLQIEVDAERQEWDGFEAYIGRIAGSYWVDGLRQEAQNIAELGSDYDASDNEADEGDGHGGPGGENGGDGDDNDDAGRYYPGGGAPHVDSDDDSIFGDNERGDNEAQYKPPTRTKRTRIADANDDSPSKRSKSFHSPSKDDGNEDSDSGRPYLPTPYPKRSFSVADLDSEEEVERSINLDEDNHGPNTTARSPNDSTNARARKRPRTAELPIVEDEEELGNLVYPEPEELEELERLANFHSDLNNIDENLGQNEDSVNHYVARPNLPSFADFVRESSVPLPDYNWGNSIEVSLEEADNVPESDEGASNTSIFGFLGRIFNHYSSPARPSPQAPKPTAGQGHQYHVASSPRFVPPSPSTYFHPYHSPSPPVQPTPGPSTFQPFSDFQSTPSPGPPSPRRPTMPNCGPRPLRRARSRIYFNGEIHEYDEGEDWKEHMVQFEEEMDVRGVKDWKAPPNFISDLADIRSMPPLALYGFCEE